MRHNILIIIGFVLLSIFLISYKIKEKFENEQVNNKEQLNNLKKNTNVANKSNTLNNTVIANNTSTTKTINNVNKDESQNVLNNLLNIPNALNNSAPNNSSGDVDNIYKNASVNVGGSDYYQFNFMNKEINSEEADINLDFKIPEIILESVGVRKLILHWQSEVPDGYRVMKYNINIYKCKNLELCNIEDAEEVTNFDRPNPTCKSCYLIINNMDMGNHIYIVKMQIVYQNITTGQLVMGPIDVKTTVKEVEQDLTKMYKDVLDNLIDENIKQKQVDMEQHLQKKKIDELRNKITELKSKLLKSEKYSGELNEMLKPPFPIKTYYNGINFFDAKKATQQTIKYGDKEYYIGLTSN
jgi:hypothetical protein